MQKSLKLFVANLPPQAKREEVEAYFTQVCGSKVTAQKGKNKGKNNKKNAIITLPNQQSLDFVLNASLLFQGRKLLLKPFLPSDQRLIQIARNADRRILVNVTPKTISDEEILKCVGSYGEIEEVFFQRTKGTNKLKTAFITFCDSKSARKAVETQLIHFGDFRLKISHYKISLKNLMKLEVLGDDLTKAKLNKYAQSLKEGGLLKGDNKSKSTKVHLLGQSPESLQRSRLKQSQWYRSQRQQPKNSRNDEFYIRGHILSNQNREESNPVQLRGFCDESSSKDPKTKVYLLIRVLFHPESPKYIRFNRPTAPFNSQRKERLKQKISPNFNKNNKNGPF